MITLIKTDIKNIPKKAQDWLKSSGSKMYTSIGLSMLATFIAYIYPWSFGGRIVTWIPILAFTIIFLVSLNLDRSRFFDGSVLHKDKKFWLILGTSFLLIAGIAIGIKMENQLNTTLCFSDKCLETLNDKFSIVFKISAGAISILAFYAAIFRSKQMKMQIDASIYFNHKKDFIEYIESEKDKLFNKLTNISQVYRATFPKNTTTQLFFGYDESNFNDNETLYRCQRLSTELEDLINAKPDEKNTHHRLSDQWFYRYRNILTDFGFFIDHTSRERDTESREGLESAMEMHHDALILLRAIHRYYEYGGVNYYQKFQMTEGHFETRITGIFRKFKMEADAEWSRKFMIKTGVKSGRLES